MRISGGEMKGRKIPKKSLGICSVHGVLRATSSKVREAIFNIIGNRVEGAVFLDLYAGTGAVGAEAMSRKASKVYFVEADSKRVASIEDLLSGCGCRERAEIRNEKAVDFIERASAGGMKFDVVFMDPPYGSGEVHDAISRLGDCGALSPDAVVIAEHGSKVATPRVSGCLEMKKTYRYGDTSLTLYEVRA